MASTIFNNMNLRARYYSWNPSTTQVGINTIYYVATSVVGAPTDTAVVAALSAAAMPFYAALQSAQTTAYGAGLAIMNTGLATQLTAEVTSTAGQAAGTVGNLTIANQVSFVITLLSGFASRQKRGRVYPPFPSESFSDNPGRMTAAGQVVLQQLAQWIQTPFTFNDHAGNSLLLTPLIRHVTKRVRPIPDDASYVAAVSAVGRLKFATQRKRGQYGRLNPVPF